MKKGSLKAPDKSSGDKKKKTTRPKLRWRVLTDFQNLRV